MGLPGLAAQALLGLSDLELRDWGVEGAVAFQGALWLFPLTGKGWTAISNLKAWPGWAQYGVEGGDGIFGCDLFGVFLRERDGQVESLDLLHGAWSAEGAIDTWIARHREAGGQFLGAGLAREHGVEEAWGQRLSVYPPWIFDDHGQGRSYKLVSLQELMAYQADLFRQIRDVPNGARVEIQISKP